ncbi:MAG: right-handed parallel beta-helix repeat-containing protein, partial [Acidobacteria bacterium]|nr:right-handed parallel beta-helix repeat-containing protein [Acidobacteriota bacterium]
LVVRNPSSSSLLRKVGVAGSAGTVATGSVAALLAALAALATPAAAVATYTVDDASDGAANASDCTTPVAGSCSLRDAAAAAVDGDTITFAAGISSITLTTGRIELAAVNLAGPGSGALTITTTAAAGSYTMFGVSGTGNATISGLKITKCPILAGNDGDFTLDDVIVEDSESDFSTGGALYAYNQGDVFIKNSQFKNNDSSGNAGAIYLTNSGDVTITDSSFESNAASGGGGAIYIDDPVGDFTLERSTLTGNSSTNSYGGGLESHNSGDVTITDSVIDGNTALYAGGVALKQTGDTNVTRTSIIGNSATGAAGSGGGLYVASEAGTHLTVVSSLIADNTATQSGGGALISSEIDATIANSTITGNSTDGIGGGLALEPDLYLTLLQTTISDNSANFGGGLYAKSGVDVSMSGSIISGNTGTHVTATSLADDIVLNPGFTSADADFTSENSIIGTVSTNVTVTDQGGTIRTDDPGLEALADNGGPTRTMALSATSVALDAGPATVATFPDNQYDQRGIGYARVANG